MMEEQQLKQEKEAELNKLNKAQKQERLFKEQYEIEKKQLREKVIIERDNYLNLKVKEFALFLHDEGIKTINDTLIDTFISSSNPSENIEFIYDTLKEYVDDIKKVKQDEADDYATKYFNEADVQERAIRKYENKKIVDELKTKNQTEIADLRHYLRSKHENDIKTKHMLVESMNSKQLYLTDIMKERQQELKERTERFIEAKTQQIKNTILERAMGEFKKMDRIRKIKESDQRRREIAEKKLRESGGVPRPANDDTEDSGTGGFSRRGFGTEKPVLPERRYENTERDDNSDKPKGKPVFGRKDGGGFGRDGFGKEKPVFSNSGGKDTKDSSESGPPAFGNSSGIKFGDKPKFLSSKPKEDNSGFKRTFTKPKDDDGFTRSTTKPKADDGFTRNTAKPKEEEKNNKKTTTKPKMKTRKDKQKNAPKNRFGEDW